MPTIMLINVPKREYGSDQEGTTELGSDNSYPVGLLLISSAIKNDGKVAVEYLDANFYQLDLCSIQKRVKEINPDYIGLNATFPNLHIVRRLSTLLKPDAHRKIIVGGPAATLAPEYILENSSADFIVIGEGERTIVELLHCLDSKSNPSRVDGIAYKDSGGRILRTPKRGPLPMEEVPLVDVQNIPYEIRKHSREITLFTQRGCENFCSFCSTPAIWGVGKKNVRNQTVERIFEEIENHRRNGFEFESVHFLDDSFTSDWDRVERFMEEWNRTYKKEGITWRCLSRIRAINSPEKIDKLIESGLTQVSVGVESASPRILQKIGKGLTLAEVDEFLKHCGGKNIVKKGFFMIGFPDETEEDIMRTIDYARNSSFDHICVNIVMGYPGTRLYNQVYGKDAVQIPKFGDIDTTGLKREKTKEMMNKYSSTPAVSLTKHVSIERLYELKRLAFEGFYHNG